MNQRRKRRVPHDLSTKMSGSPTKRYQKSSKRKENEFNGNTKRIKENRECKKRYRRNLEIIYPKNTKFSMENKKSIGSKRFGKDVGNLVISVNVLKENFIVKNFVTKKMMFDVNVFRSRMSDGVLCKKIVLVLSQKGFALPTLTPKSKRQFFIQMDCEHAKAVEIYSSSVVNNATQFCFLEDHATSESPM